MSTTNNIEECTREDLRVVVIANAYVDDIGQHIPGDHMLITAGISAEPKPYFCNGPCGQDFEMWEEALEHLKRKEAS